MQTEKDNAILELVHDAFRMTFAAIGADRVVQRSLFPSDWKERYNSRLSGTKAYADKLYSRMSYICKGDDVCEMLYGFIKDSSKVFIANAAECCGGRVEFREQEVSFKLEV